MQQCNLLLQEYVGLTGKPRQASVTNIHVHVVTTVYEENMHKLHVHCMYA